MIHLTNEMRELIDNALANGTPCILATASATGEPNVGIRGSMMVFDDTSLAYWERSKRGSLAHITENPKVVVFFRDPSRRVNWRFHGTATIHMDGPIREQIMSRVVKAEIDRDPQRQGYAVFIKLDKVTSLGGEVLQRRD